MSEKLYVKDAVTLLPFLQASLQQWSRNTIKQRLQNGCVFVNGDVITQHNHPLAVGDTVEVGAATKVKVGPIGQLDVLYSDRDLVAINKPAGLLAVGTSGETQQHALAILRSQLSRRGENVKLWPVNRIDRDTSGVMLFATSKEMREAVMDNWDKAEKYYLAITEGCPTPAEGTIDQPLRQDEVEYRMHVGEHPDAKPAITHYATERTQGARAQLKVKLETGRQHQIRAHLAWLGYPVVGDQRYGTAGERMGLHALKLSIRHPTTGKLLSFTASAPADFSALMGDVDNRVRQKTKRDGYKPKSTPLRGREDDSGERASSRRGQSPTARARSVFTNVKPAAPGSRSGSKPAAGRGKPSKRRD